MDCPNEGQLLLYAEKQLTGDESIRIADHLKTCAYCSQKAEEIKQTLNFASQHLLPPDQARQAKTGQHIVWQNINRHMNTGKREVLKMKIKKVTIAAAVVLALVMVGSIPSVQSAAANFLQIFRVQKVDTLTLSPADMEQIEQALRQGTNGQPIDLESFGTIKVDGQQQQTPLSYDQLGSLDFTVKLPGSADPAQGEYSLQTIPDVEITPNVSKVNALIQALGSDKLLPETLDGKTFRLKMGKCLVASYGDFRLVQGPSPELEAPGDANVSDIAQAMIALPIWPDNVKKQLEMVTDWQHTLLIPGQNNEKVKVQGQDAVLIKDGSTPVLVWQDNGLVYSLEGCSGKNLDLVEIADNLR